MAESRRSPTCCQLSSPRPHHSSFELFNQGNLHALSSPTVEKQYLAPPSYSNKSSTSIEYGQSPVLRSQACRVSRSLVPQKARYVRTLVTAESPAIPNIEPNLRVNSSDDEIVVWGPGLRNCWRIRKQHWLDWLWCPKRFKLDSSSRPPPAHSS